MVQKKELNKLVCFKHTHVFQLTERKRKLNRPAETINWKI